MEPKDYYRKDQQDERSYRSIEFYVLTFPFDETNRKIDCVIHDVEIENIDRILNSCELLSKQSIHSSYLLLDHQDCRLLMDLSVDYPGLVQSLRLHIFQCYRDQSSNPTCLVTWTFFVTCYFDI